VVAVQKGMSLLAIREPPGPPQFPPKGTVFGTIQYSGCPLLNTVNLRNANAASNGTKAVGLPWDKQTAGAVLAHRTPAGAGGTIDAQLSWFNLVVW
jgi:hypothetical protein